MTRKDRLDPTTTATTAALALPCMPTAGIGRSGSLSLTSQTVEDDSMDRSEWGRVARLANRISQLADYGHCGELLEAEAAEIQSSAGELFGILNSAVDAQRG